MIDMNDKLMVDRDCFERGCMSIPHTHVRPIKEGEVVWMVKEQPEPTRWKPWVELTDDDLERLKLLTFEKEINAYGEEQEAVDLDQLMRATEQLCRERNT